MTQKEEIRALREEVAELRKQITALLDIERIIARQPAPVAYPVIPYVPSVPWDPSRGPTITWGPTITCGTVCSQDATSDGTILMNTTG